MYEYNCKIVRVVDGDTVDVDIDLGFGVWLHKERIRLHGIDAPETRQKCLCSLGTSSINRRKLSIIFAFVFV